MGETTDHVYPVLLAGGIGSRLWPVSRERYPKQLVKLIGEDSLVQSTVKRLCLRLDVERLRIVCGKAHDHQIARHLAEIQIRPEGKIITEPCGRNTAPAILLAVLHILETDPDAVICVFPADHVIRQTKRFHDKLTDAISLANWGYIVTFGIPPHYPETDYGYIEGGEPVARGALETRRFVEKPDRATAEHYLASGNFFWNSGMFAFKAAVIVEEFKRYQRSLWNQMRRLNRSESPIAQADYDQLPNISIDYAIMESTRKGVVLPSDFGWSDIGTWKSVYEFLPKDDRQNVFEGDVIAHHTHGSFILAHQRLIATNGLNRMVIVDTPDSIFVSTLDNSRDVKQIVSELKEKNRREYQQHRIVHRPWGSSTLLEQHNACRVERLVLNAAAECALPDPEPGTIHLTLLEGAAEIKQTAKTIPLQQGGTVSLESSRMAVLRNLSMGSALTAICISIPANQMGLSPQHNDNPDQRKDP